MARSRRRAASSASNSAHLRPHRQLAGLEHLRDRRQLRRADVRPREPDRLATDCCEVLPAHADTAARCGTTRSSARAPRRARRAARSRAARAPCRRSGSAARRRCSGAAGRRSRRGQPVRRLIRCARSKIVTAERGVADVEALADRVRVLEREQRALDHVVDVAPGADLRAVAVDRQVAARERGLDEGADRAAADLARPVDVERPHRRRRQRRARRGRRAPCARPRAWRRRTSSAPRRPSRSTVTLVSATLNACVPKTSLVEKSTSRSSVSCVASAASSTL